MPFRNLKFIIIFNKALGFISCKLVNGQLKSSSAWNRSFCIIWVLFHCFYMGLHFYNIYTLPDENDKDNIIDIVRSFVYFVSVLPYYFVPIFCSEDLIKLSDKLLAYDEQAIALGHRRKDKHIFLYLYLLYTFTTISWKYYNELGNSISQGISSVLHTVFPNICGIYCTLISCIFLDLIRQRFRHLNEAIIPCVSELPVTGSQDEITVYDVRYLHGMLLHSAELINTLYGIGTLITVILILSEYLGSMYTFIKSLQNNEDVEDHYAEILNLSCGTIYFFAMYHFTTYEANRVEERVTKYGLAFSNTKCRMDKIEMMLYFYHRRYSFTAAGFFPVNMMILLPISTAIATYLILIV